MVDSLLLLCRRLRRGRRRLALGHEGGEALVHHVQVLLHLLQDGVQLGLVVLVDLQG